MIPIEYTEALAIQYNIAIIVIYFEFLLLIGTIMVDLCFYSFGNHRFSDEVGQIGCIAIYSRTPHFPAKWAKWLVFPIKLRKAKVKL